MCDIAGWVGPGVNKTLVTEMMKYIGESNRDASGMALHSGKKISIFKMPGPSSGLIKRPDWNEWYDERASDLRAGILHARIATNGRPEKNVNNHPHWSDSGSVLVHKGVVRPVTQYKAKSECDSEQILLSLDDRGFEEGIVNCPGWMSVGVFHHDTPNVLWLFTNASKLWLIEKGKTKLFCTKSLDKAKEIPQDQWIGLPFDGGAVLWGPKIQRAVQPANMSSLVTPGMYMGDWD